MPQMFPLLWYVLFMLTASALFMMISTIHFSASKPNKTISSETKILSDDHNWKW